LLPARQRHRQLLRKSPASPVYPRVARPAAGHWQHLITVITFFLGILGDDNQQTTETEVFPRILVLLISNGLASLYAHGQVITISGGNTVRVASKHDYASLEANLPLRQELWEKGQWYLDLNHAFSVSGFHDVNNVYLASWAPNLILRWQNRHDFYPYFQIGFGVALLSDDYFESEDNDPRHTGTTDMGSHGQFESSIAVGVIYGQFGVRAKLYHYSNANISSTNDGIDVAELGLSYLF
jgi:hypothetical protein